MRDRTLYGACVRMTTLLLLSFVCFCSCVLFTLCNNVFATEVRRTINEPTTVTFSSLLCDKQEYRFLVKFYCFSYQSSFNPCPWIHTNFSEALIFPFFISWLKWSMQPYDVSAWWDDTVCIVEEKKSWVSSLPNYMKFDLSYQY